MQSASKKSRSAKKIGRPKTQVDWKVAEKLGRIHCTEAEICAFLEVNVKQIDARCLETYGTSFGEWIKKQHEHAKCSLRRAQYKSAMAGNVAMLIWLGKQWLNQHDRNELVGANGQPIEIVVTYSTQNGTGK